MNWALPLLAYLLGSIPTGLVVGRALKGLDLRTVGSGNIGAANAFRHLGPVGGALVLLGDLSKGMIPVLMVCHGPLAVHDSLFAVACWEVGVGMMAIVGHNNSLFLGFKGGKGIATSLGVAIALSWQAALCCLGVWAVAMAVTRYASVASLSGSLCMPVAMYLWLPHETPDERQALTVYLSFAVLATVLAFYKHRRNIANLLEGVEPRMFSRAKPPEQPPS